VSARHLFLKIINNNFIICELILGGEKKKMQQRAGKVAREANGIDGDLRHHCLDPRPGLLRVVDAI
jgi:hypothetical protein